MVTTVGARPRDGSGVTHERTTWPSRCTVHAPHSASPQPYLVPVRPSTSRSAHSSGISGSTSRRAPSPLTRTRDAHGSPPSAGTRRPVSTHAAISAPNCSCVPGAGSRSCAGRPAPGDELVVRVVLDDLRERLAAVALRVLDLLADVARRLADPRHLDGREVPVRRARHARVLQVAILMAARALHADHAAVVRAARDRRIVQAHLHALQRHVAVRVAVGAARMRAARGWPQETARASAPSSPAMIENAATCRSSLRATGGSNTFSLLPQADIATMTTQPRMLEFFVIFFQGGH